MKKSRPLAMGSAMLGLILVQGTVSPARERHIDVAEYTAQADSICVCRVEKQHDNGSVTVTVLDPIKGQLKPDAEVVLSGPTGDIGGGMAADYLQVGKKYLVFLFPGNKVSRNSNGILAITDGRVDVESSSGWKNALQDPNTGRHFLPVEEAVRQLRLRLEDKEGR